MVVYQVLILAAAEKSLNALERQDYVRVSTRIAALGQNPRPPGCRKLANSDAYRLRVGDYRVVYTVNDMKVTVLVVRVAHRREAYRDIN